MKKQTNNLHINFKCQATKADISDGVSSKVCRNHLYHVFHTYLSWINLSHAHFVYVQSNVYNFHNIYIKKYFFELDGNLCENYNNYY